MIHEITYLLKFQCIFEMPFKKFWRFQTFLGETVYNVVWKAEARSMVVHFWLWHHHARSANAAAFCFNGGAHYFFKLVVHCTQLTNQMCLHMGQKSLILSKKYLIWNPKHIDVEIFAINCVFSGRLAVIKQLPSQMFKPILLITRAKVLCNPIW